MINNVAVARCLQTSIACPEQYEGQLQDGRRFYFRLRHGKASLGLSAVSVTGAADDPHTVRKSVGDPLQGIFQTSHQRDTVFAELLGERLVAG